MIASEFFFTIFAHFRTWKSCHQFRKFCNAFFEIFDYKTVPALTFTI
jgi:hypothetical protein